MIPMCTPHLPDFPTESPQDRRRNRIRALKYLGARLVEAKALLATVDIALLGPSETAAYLLRAAAGQLDLLLGEVHEQVLEAHRSGPRTP
jgi:hypothetical protein